MRPHTFAAFFVWYLRRFDISKTQYYEVELTVQSKATKTKYYRIELVSDYPQEITLRVGGGWGCDITFQETPGNPIRLLVKHRHGESSNIEETIQIYDQHQVVVSYSGHPAYQRFEFDLGDFIRPEKARQNYFYGVSSSANTSEGTQALQVNRARSIG